MVLLLIVAPGARLIIQKRGAGKDKAAVGTIVKLIRRQLAGLPSGGMQRGAPPRRQSPRTPPCRGPPVNDSFLVFRVLDVVFRL